MGSALRKIAAILLLIILLFNWVGYRLVSDFLQHRATIQLQAKLDKNDYREDQLIEIKVPLHLPYQLNWREFERFDGEINVVGQWLGFEVGSVFPGHVDEGQNHGPTIEVVSRAAGNSPPAIAEQLAIKLFSPVEIVDLENDSIKCWGHGRLLSFYEIKP